MTRAVRRLHHLARAFREPSPQRVLERSVPVTQRPVVVRLVGASTLGKAAERLLAGNALGNEREVLLIPDVRPDAAISPSVLSAVAEALSTSTTVAVGVPSDTDSQIAHRLGAATAESGYDLRLLGSEGWDRVKLGARAEVLHHVDLPTEVNEPVDLVALTRAGGYDGCVSMWTRFVHPNTRLRALADSRATAELSLACDATYVISASAGTTDWLAMTDDRIGAELVHRGLSKINGERSGIEERGPWESPTVQHLTDIAAGVTIANDLVLSVLVMENARIARSWIARLSEMLNCRIEIVAEPGGSCD